MLQAASSVKNPLVQRVEIAQAALTRFGGRPFKWGVDDCAKLAAYVLKLAGYKPNLSQFGDYKTDLAARRALKNREFSSVVNWIDSVGVARCFPAATLPGDLVAFPGVGGWDGLAVVLGNGRVLAFTETEDDGRCSIIAADFRLAVAAWNVTPCRK